MRTKEELPECPVATAVSLIGGKWKLLILRNLKERPWRFNELQRSKADRVTKRGRGFDFVLFLWRICE